MTERENSKPVHIGVHIEKTGGTTLEAKLTDLYEAHNILIYRPTNGQFSRLSEIQLPRTSPWVDLIKRLLRRFPIFMPIAAKINVINSNRARGYSLQGIGRLVPRPRAVYGHFTADLLDGVYPESESFWTVVLRDPLKRMISHYWHYWTNRGNTLFRIQLEFPLSFEDFAFHPNLQNYQSQALGERPLECFDLVGTTEDLSSFVQRLTHRVTEEWPESVDLPHLNRSPQRVTLDDLGIQNPERFVQLFRQHHALDYQNYQKALELS